MTDTIALRRAERADIPQLARMFADSFADDPFVSWIVRDDARRRASFEHLFVVTLEALSSKLRETYTDEALSGCIVWRTSAECKLPLWRELALVPAFCKISGVARIPQLFAAFAQLDALHEHHAPEPHQYLHVLGVAPERQRRGIGHALLQPALDRFDAAMQPAYLETFKASNLPFYERHGFRCVGRVESAPLPPGWLMRREPKQHHE
ncbi:MAG TPA: GNAT family N-acetyltransferase [Polyangiaceae bacterium]|nr:GNAT family N-acetyltransferase [Polyangiaceae bacterium]